MSHTAQLPQTASQWHWRVFNLAWPVILSNLTIPLVGMVDTAVVGQLPDARYMAAVAIGAIVFSNIFWVFGFLRMSTTGFVAQAQGANDSVGVSIALLRALLLAVLLGMLVIILQTPLSWAALELMGAEPAVTALAQQYIDIRVWSAPATFINYTVLGCLIGLQQMRLALLTQLVLNGANIVLDIVLVMGFGWGVEGVAWASLLSDYLAAGLGLWFLRAYWLPVLREVGASLQARQQLLEQQALRAMLAVNTDLFLRTLLLTMTFFIFTAQGAQMGTEVIAANAILISLLQMSAYGLDGFANAAESLAGSAYGARDKQSFRHAIRYTSIWALIMAGVTSALFAFLGVWVIDTMTVIAEVRDTAESYLIWVVLAPIIAVWSYQLDGIFIGATQTRLMLVTVAISFVLYLIFLLLVPWWGNHGLWLAMMVFLLARGVGLGVCLPRLERRVV